MKSQEFIHKYLGTPIHEYHVEEYSTHYKILKHKSKEYDEINHLVMVKDKEGNNLLKKEPMCQHSINVKINNSNFIDITDETNNNICGICYRKYKRRVLSWKLGEKGLNKTYIGVRNLAKKKLYLEIENKKKLYITK